MRKQVGAPGGSVRVGPASGPVALPMDRDPRVPARHRGQGHGRLGVQGSPHRGADHQHQVLQADEPAGTPFIPVEFAVAAYRFGHSITRPRYTVRDFFDQRWHHPWLCLGRAAVRGPTPTDNNLNGSPRTAASAEDSVEQVLQRGRAEPDRPARAPVRRLTGRPTVQAALDGAARHEHSRVCCRSGTSSGAGRWACPRDSRWLG